jgi:hypothetical protein
MRVSLLLALTALTASAKSINPAVKRIVDVVSEGRIANIEKKLESFETRNIFSESGPPHREESAPPALGGEALRTDIGRLFCSAAVHDRSFVG